MRFRKRGDPSLGGGWGTAGAAAPTRHAPRQRRVTDSQFAEFPGYPQLLRRHRRSDYEPNVVGSRLPGLVVFADRTLMPGLPHTCVHWRGTVRSCRSCMSARQTSHLRPCTMDGRYRQPRAVRIQGWCSNPAGKSELDEAAPWCLNKHQTRQGYAQRRVGRLHNSRNRLCAAWNCVTS